jgi:hypothetical protein
VKGCECEWKAHEGRPCHNPPADHGAVRTSPELCMPCLYVCCAEEDDEIDTRSAGEQRG